MKSFNTMVILFCTLIGMNACAIGSIDIHHDRLQVALVDDVYDQYFDIDYNWNDFFNYDHAFYLTDGDLPAGLEVLDSGRLVGVAYERGSFDFEVSVYGYDYDGYSEYLDSAWFTVFVTEPSTNANCPQPDSSSATEIYLCLGDVDEQQVSTGDEILLDLNYYVRPEIASAYSIQKIDFVINYDATSFSVDEETLNSGLLREAASIYDATVHIDSSVAGQLTVSIISGSAEGFRYAGRLMDIPFTALTDLALSNYDFTLDDTEMLPLRASVSLPEIIDLDGSLSVEDPVTPPAAGIMPSVEGI